MPPAIFCFILHPQADGPERVTPSGSYIERSQFAQSNVQRVKLCYIEIIEGVISVC